MKPRPKNKRSKMNFIGDSVSKAEFQKIAQSLQGLEGDIFDKVQEFIKQTSPAKESLLEKIQSKMETAGFVPAFLDGNFKSEYVDFQVEILNPASSGIIISAKNLKYNLSFVIGLTGDIQMDNSNQDNLTLRSIDCTIVYTFQSDNENVNDSEVLINLNKLPINLFVLII